jgi:hypothetical protein
VRRQTKRQRAPKPQRDPVYVDGFTWFYPSRRGFEFVAYRPGEVIVPGTRPVTFTVPTPLLVGALEALELVRRVR